MWVPLAILAVLSLIGGWAFNIPTFLSPLFPLQEGEAGAWLTWVSVAFGLGGIGLAYLFYVVAPGIPESLVHVFKGPYKLIYNKYFVDELYDSAVVTPVVDGSRTLLWRVADSRMIDGAVNGIGATARGVGSILRLAQSGYIRSYAAWVLAGTIIVVAYEGIRGSGAVTAFKTLLEGIKWPY
jgi:NADH-quinone oxidoreductase subunit L